MYIWKPENFIRDLWVGFEIFDSEVASVSWKNLGCPQLWLPNRRPHSVSVRKFNGKDTETAAKTCQGVLKSLWGPHKSKDHNFLHRSYVQKYFSRPKNIFLRLKKKISKYFLKIFFLIWKNQIFEAKSRIFENLENFKIWFFWSNFSDFRFCKKIAKNILRFFFRPQKKCFGLQKYFLDIASM